MCGQENKKIQKIQTGILVVNILTTQIGMNKMYFCPEFVQTLTLNWMLKRKCSSENFGGAEIFEACDTVC